MSNRPDTETKDIACKIFQDSTCQFLTAKVI